MDVEEKNRLLLRQREPMLVRIGARGGVSVSESSAMSRTLAGYNARKRLARAFLPSNMGGTAERSVP
ncbi:MAG: hypothetical protein J6K61_05250 [Clostridia bacterium]|nr:hypothetical protein [Clostridia bacterium]